MGSGETNMLREFSFDGSTCEWYASLTFHSQGNGWRRPCQTITFRNLRSATLGSMKSNIRQLHRRIFKASLARATQLASERRPDLQSSARLPVPLSPSRFPAPLQDQPV